MNPKLLDTVTNIKPIAKERLTLVETDYQSALPKGQVGTIVEVYDNGKAYYLVEFANRQGHE